MDNDVSLDQEDEMRRLLSRGLPGEAGLVYRQVANAIAEIDYEKQWDEAGARSQSPHVNGANGRPRFGVWFEWDAIDKIAGTEKK